MKRLAILACFLVAACGVGHIHTIPDSPVVNNVVTNDVPVPVLCKAEIAKAQSAIDTAKTGLALEEQNAILRQSLAEQQAYIKALEAGVVGCGGKIK